MPEPKAQLVDPQGPIDVPGMQVTGVTTATGGFVGQVQGAATGFAATTYNITAGVVTSTGFVGDVTGTASSVTKGANLSLGIVTASSFAGDVFGNAAGLSTTTAGLKLGIVSATSFAGNFTGIGSGITGTPNIQAGIMTATSFAGNFTGLASGITGTPNLMVGILTGTAYSGDGSALTGIAATNWIANNVTANSSTTTVNLSLGNIVKFTQSANTTVSFANTGTSNIVTFIRVDDNSGTDRTITWPSSIKWDGGIAPTLINNTRTTDAQVFNFLTRDEGVTWYGWETVNADPQTFSLWIWGSNSNGQLGQNSPTTAHRSSPVQIGSGTDWSSGGNGVYSLTSTNAIKNDGTLWVWGLNAHGELGQATNKTYYSSPVQIPGTTWGVCSRGVRSMASIKTDGTLWMWGRNGPAYGDLGQNSLVGYSSPVQVPGTTWSTMGQGYYSIQAIKTDGTLWAWGMNSMGQLAQNNNGAGGNNNNRSSPVQIPGSTWSKTARVYFNSCGAVRTDGTLFVWGNNTNGELGLNNLTRYSSPTQLPGTWANICGDNGSTLATKTDNTLWSWGSGQNGRHAQNNQTDYSSPIQIPGTNWHTEHFFCGDGGCRALKTDGTLWAWGRGQYGDNGTGNTKEYSSPVQVGSDTDWAKLYAGAMGGIGLRKVS